MKSFEEYTAEQVDAFNKRIKQVYNSKRAYIACQDLVNKFDILADEEPANSSFYPTSFLIWLYPIYTKVAKIAEIVDEWAKLNKIKITQEKTDKTAGYYRMSTNIDGTQVDIDIHFYHP
jgi:hypothetical protein